MTLQESLREDLKVAMKARDTERTGAIRILMGEFARQPEKVLSDEQVIAIVKKLIKSERELLAAQKQESSPFLTIMEEYLPKQASEEEIFAWVEKNIDFSAYGSKMQAMKPIMQHFGSAVNGNVVKKVLEKF
ncbi:GatB/YqeY domain-containing protein [Desulfocastanea catecholica]